MTIQQILEFISKAAIATTVGGQLTAAQAKQFIDLTVSQNTLLQKIQTVQMTAAQYQLNTIEIASRVMRAATEGTDPAFTQGVTITPRTLTQKESILPYDITFSFLEENIEGANAESKINEMFAKSFGNDLLDLAINGDESLATTITDGDADGLDDTTQLAQNDHTFLKQNDGWLDLMRADATVHDVEISETVTSWIDEFDKILSGMPNKWKNNPADLLLLVSPDVESAYRKEVSGRATLAGDKYLLENARIPYAGIDVEPVAFFPGITSSHYPAGPVIVLTKPKNLAIGIGRDMRIGRQVQERKRVIEYTVTAKTDFNYVVGDMIVKAEKA